MKFDAEDFKDFFTHLAENGYHIFSRELARRGGFYPNPFPSIPGLDVGDLKPNDKITIRVFFPVDKTPMPRVDSGYIDLEVEHVDPDTQKVFANILTELPKTFALSKGTTIELDLDEILTRQPS